MAVGQTRSIREGFNSATAKIRQNFFQFALTALLVMACGATNKVTRHCEIEKETSFHMRVHSSRAPGRGRAWDMALARCNVGGNPFPTSCSGWEGL